MRSRSRSLFMLFSAFILVGQTLLMALQPAPVQARPGAATTTTAVDGDCVDPPHRLYLPIVKNGPAGAQANATLPAEPAPDHHRRCIVPDVVGMAEAAARATIAGAELTPGASARQHSTTVEVGHVISQTPGAGTDVDAGATVDLVVSLGPDLVMMPDVVGLLQADAEAAVSSAGLALRAVTTNASDTVPAGHVIAQTPAADTEVLPATPVDLLVSTGPVNEAPAITSTPVLSTTEGQTYGYDVTATDADGDDLAFSLPLAPAGMAIDVDTGLIQWTPVAGQVGQHDVTVKVADPAGLFAQQTFVVAVAGVNVAPTAYDDAYDVRADEVLTVAAPGVLANDEDANGDPLTATLVTTPTRGALDLQSDGAFTYTPTQSAYSTTAPALKYEFNSPYAERLRDMPLVADLNQDGVAEILFIGYGVGFANVVAIHGDSADVYFSVAAYNPPTYTFSAGGQMATGDVDGDGYPEILFPGGASHAGGTGYGQKVIALEHDGTYKWTSEDVEEDQDEVLSGSGFTKIALANILGDERPEILVGYAGSVPSNNNAEIVTVFDHQGNILWNGHDQPGDAGEGAFPASGYVAVADIDLDGDMEVLYSDDVYDHQGNRLFKTDLRVNEVVPANLDDDPYPELIYREAYPVQGRLHAYEHDGAFKWQAPSPPSNAAGQITVGDADGDGEVEIGAATSQDYVLYEPDGTVAWTRPITDARHGFGTFFDLNGDGAPEIIYQADIWADGRLYILNGADGATLHTVPANEAWLYGPLVADVDGDGAAEIVVGQNTSSSVPAISVFEAAEGEWAPTRPIWNQATYHVTNVNADGTIPAAEQNHWLVPGLNLWRSNALLPGEDPTRYDTFSYTAGDGTLASGEADVHLTILPPGNPPEILTDPAVTATVGFPYQYGVLAHDPDAGDVLSYTLTAAPAGMTIDPTTGLVQWTPAMTGTYEVAIAVADTQGFAAVQDYTLTVLEPVTVPDVVGQTQAQAASALDAAGLAVGDVVSDTHPTAPAGTVAAQSPPGNTVAAPGSGVALTVSLGPHPDDVDDDDDTFSENEGDCDDTDDAIYPGAPDPDGDGVDQNCDGADGVHVLVAIVVEPVTQTLLTGESVSFRATGVYSDGTGQTLTGLVAWSSSNSAVASITADGTATGLSDGTTTIGAGYDGVSGETMLAVRAQVSGDTTPPSAALTAPAANISATGPLTVTGIATDTHFLKYELGYAPAGETTFTPLATGTTPVNDGVFGVFDPTLLLNDLYTLRLRAFDRAGNVSEATVTVQVEGVQKVGPFTLSFTDLTIPLPGLPLEVSRVYDSRDKGRGDFGVGWRLGVQTLRVRTNRVLGTGWRVNKQGLSYVLAPTDGHKVSVTLPDGRVEEFDLQVTPAASPLVPFIFLTASFVPRPGTRGTLEALDNPYLAILDGQPGEVQLLDDTTFAVYDPQTFRYTNAEGTRTVVHVSEGVQSATDANGNTLTVGPNAITHSAGPSITFQRDPSGRITQITDLDGNVQTYTYDANGDLVTHTDRAGNTTRFRYNRHHGLIKIIDPLGRPAARNEYDEGRLIATTDAQGNRVELTHDVGARLEVIEDRLGNVTVHEYDAQGNVVATTDPLGNRTEYTYDAQGNVLAETDPLGRTATWTYDEDGHVLSDTNFEGNTTTYTYDAHGRVLTTTDPAGYTTTYAYDARGNLVQVTDPEGGVTTHTYDAAGNRLSTTDPLDRVTTYSYDQAGNRTAIVDPAGNVTTFTYDAHGNVLAETRTRTRPDGTTQTLTTQFEYDPAGREVRRVDPLGNETTTTYDALGRRTSVTDPLGRVTTYTYDANGNLTATTFPDGSTALATYDAEGRQLTQTNRDGHTTTFVYNALGRRTTIIYPDGAVVSTTYDATGRVLSETDARGHTTTYSYAPNRQTITDALGNVTVHTFDGRDRLLQTTDARGHTTTYSYDGNGNRVATTFPDGTTTTATYDPAGNKVSETDQMSRTTGYEYDALDRLLRVTAATGAQTTYTYDEVGNRVAVADVNGHVTRMEYDVLGRLTRRIRPMGQAEQVAYDANGNRVSHTSFNGYTTTFTYDSNDRLVQKTFPNGTTVAFAYTPAGLRTQAGGAGFVYDARGRLVEETKDGGETLSYTYDAAGNRTAVTTPAGTTGYVYDALNRLEAVQAPAGGVTTYTYDAAGNRATVTYPNGTHTAYTYDDLNRLVSLVNQADDGTTLSSYTYTLDPAGTPLQVTDDHTGRVVAYTYDDLNRLVGEAIDDPAAGERTITYTYDAVGNRLSRADTATGTTTYSYDANDRLVAENAPAGTVTYTYDAAGNLLSRSTGTGTDAYGYDLEDRLVAASVGLDGGTDTVTYTYDADGIRTGRVVNGVVTSYLVDENRPFAQVLAETTGAETTGYVYGQDLISLSRPGGGTRYYHYDGQTSTRQLTDAGGAVTDSYTYDAFGTLLDTAGATPNPYRYAGEQFDPALGFYYLRARYYAQETGRFLTTDPFPGDVFAPATLHRYLYANANPVTHVDPSGEYAISTALFAVLFIWGALQIGAAPPAFESVGGRTDTFTLRFCGGGAVGGWGGAAGVDYATIAEEGVPNPRYAKYRLDFTGVGVGLSFTTSSDGDTFTTDGRRRLADFIGQGRIANASAGTGFITGAEAMVQHIELPEGTRVYRQGVGPAAGDLDSVIPSLGAYWTSVVWTLIDGPQPGRVSCY